MKMHLKMWGSFLVEKAKFKKARTLPKLGFTISRKPFLKASYKAAYRTNCQTKDAPHHWRDFSKAMCTRNG
jgi:hypothetical protein